VVFLGEAMRMTTDDGRLINFERAEVITPMMIPPKPRLVVSGVLPNPEVAPTLVPLVYVSRPTYWGIQVVGSLGEHGDGPHVSQPIANVPYTVELDLAGVTGSSGVEVIGASNTERIDIPGGPAAEQ
jgi:hypothetical protein